ncbi:MAG: dTDP-glucose 4,6-dehydratase [Candidatus Micrarchaeota archaeon]
MKALVTGGAGFIGSNFVMRALAADRGNEVSVLDSLTYAADIRNLGGASGDKRYSFIKGDIRDPAAVDRAMRGCDAVVNFAAESHVDYSITNPRLFYETNVLGTLTLLESARRHDASFLQISTDEVYGDVQEGESRESDPLVPSSPYSASKAAADNLAYAFFRTYGMDVKTTRTTNNYGPFQHIEKLIPKFVLLALSGKKLPIYGSGESVREWIHVNDNCDAILGVLGKGRPGSAYNIGTGERKSVMEVARTILSALGKDASMVSHEAARPGEDTRYALDSSRMRALGWAPKIGFKSGISDTIKWYADNRSWWEGKTKTHDLGSRHTKLHKP